MEPDWQKMKASGLRFVIAKACEGNGERGDFSDVLDPVYRLTCARVRAFGMLPGTYQFVEPLPTDPEHPGRDPKEQAKAHFQKTLGAWVPGDLTHFCDAEWPEVNAWQRWGVGPSFLREWLLTYLDTYSGLLGRAMGLYTYPVWAAAAGLHDDPRFAPYPLWLADYPDAYKRVAPPDGAAPRAFPPWAGWSVWQHSGGGLLLPLATGASVPVDGNVIADEASLGRILLAA